MAETKTIPLIGRLAMQLGMLTSEEVHRAVAESHSSGNPRLAQVFLQLGLLDRAEVAKLQQVQKSLIEKHRAKKEAQARGDGVRAEADPAERAPAVGDRGAVENAAMHAAQAASPVTSEEVEALRAEPVAAPPPVASSQPASTHPSPSEPPPPLAQPVSAEPEPPVPPAPVPTVAASSGGVPSLDLPLPEVESADRAKLEAALRRGVEDRASDVHFHAGGPLKQRVAGGFHVTEETIDADSVERMVVSALDAEQRRALRERGEIDFCLDLPGVGRFRANAYRQQRGLDAVFRIIPAEPPTLEQLGLPRELEKYTDYHQGMVLITGPAGCGKSSTLAALVNHINETRDDHILTVEDPIEILHPSKRCLVNQRHAGHHTASFSRALRGALREDPDIIVIGELRDLETISLAMTAAETGHFVLATLHTANAVRTVNRMIGAFPSNEQDQVRAMLSESLRAVVSQRLVPTADGQGRVPALEMLVINRAIGNLIRDEKTVQIRSSMQTGKAHGMYLLEQSLDALVAEGRITREVALELAEEEKLITAGA